MDLPINPPLRPMLAKAVKTMPKGDLLYEPKWDGFRCIVFRDGDEVELGSRSERPLTRYFPELVEAVKRELPERCVWTARSSCRRGAGWTSTASSSASTRPRPGSSCCRSETPASFVAFDLLALGDESLMETPLGERRRRLVEALSAARAPVHVTPATDDLRPGARVVRRVRGRRPGRRRRQAARRRVRARQARPCSRSSTSGPATAWWRASAGTSPARSSGRCCSGSTTPRAKLQHVGVVGVLPDEAARRAGRGAAAAAGWSLDDHPWAEWAEPGRGAPNDRMPGAVSRWTAKKDLSLGPAASRAGRARWPTTTWRATGSGTPPASAAGGPTGRRSRARTSSSRCPSAYDLNDILAGEATSPRTDR